MNKVYAIAHYNQFNECGTIEYIFSSKELAEKYIKSIYPDNNPKTSVSHRQIYQYFVYEDLKYWGINE